MMTSSYLCSNVWKLIECGLDGCDCGLKHSAHHRVVTHVDHKEVYGRLTGTKRIFQLEKKERERHCMLSSYPLVPLLLLLLLFSLSLSLFHFSLLITCGGLTMYSFGATNSTMPCDSSGRSFTSVRFPSWSNPQK
jgi:hypothetical protein